MRVRDPLIESEVSGFRILKCTHEAQWQAARQFRQIYFFDKVPMADPYTWTFNHPDHLHFVLQKEDDILGYAHVQLWPNDRAALRIIVLDPEHRAKGLGSTFLGLIEEALKKQRTQSLHTESSPQAVPFYRKHHYLDMPFQDPDGYESDPQDIPLGKVLRAP